MAIKIVLNKPFDQLEWKCILLVLKNLGFSQRWCNNMPPCFSCTYFFFNLNGGPFGKIIPSRGIRQEDPLSPIIFILCLEFLSRSLSHLIELGEVKGVQLCKMEFL